MASIISNKTCVVTGASQGIGLELARQLLAKNNTVVAAVRAPDASPGLQQLQQQARQQQQRLHVTQLDVSSADSIKSWASGLRASVPALRHVDVLINNAGVYGPKLTLDSLTEDDMHAVFQVNTVGPLLVVQQLRAAGLLGGPGGASLVANVSSKVGSVADNRSGGGFAYRASKAALNVATKSLSIDLAGEGIAATLLHPGYVRTRMTGGQGAIDVDESAAGMLGVLERGADAINGRWFDYKNEEVPW